MATDQDHNTGQTPPAAPQGRQLPAQPVSASSPQQSVSFTPNANERLPESVQGFLPERHLGNLPTGSPWIRNQQPPRKE